MAHKKAGGSTRNGRDSHSKRLGVKHFGGESVKAGNIGKDHTLYALVQGVVKFARTGAKLRCYVNVVPALAESTERI